MPILLKQWQKSCLEEGGAERPPCSLCPKCGAPCTVAHLHLPESKPEYCCYRSERPMDIREWSFGGVKSPVCYQNWATWQCDASGNRNTTGQQDATQRGTSRSGGASEPADANSSTGMGAYGAHQWFPHGPALGRQRERLVVPQAERLVLSPEEALGLYRAHIDPGPSKCRRTDPPPELPPGAKDFNEECTWVTLSEEPEDRSSCVASLCTLDDEY